MCRMDAAESRERISARKFSYESKNPCRDFWFGEFKALDS